MIRHVLLDADGVLQRHPRGWVEAAETHLGERAAEFFAEATAAERGLLFGGDGFEDLLAALLGRYAVPAPAAEVYADVWLSLETVADTVAVVRALRARGLGVHLATNQTRGRASYMRADLGYDGLFDTSFYSCDLGVAKPDPAFFEAVLDRLEAAAPEVLFVDDHPANVAGAREAGLAAEQWTIEDGHALLHELLGRHGLAL